MRGVDLGPETGIEGYASLFWVPDLSDDVVASGAFRRSLAVGATGAGRRIRMLYQHTPGPTIGVWDEVEEDCRGLFVRGRIIEANAQARYAAAMVRSGALDGLSIGFRTRASHRDASGRLRILTEIELWEVSLVTHPMLPEARLHLMQPRAIAA